MVQPGLPSSSESSSSFASSERSSRCMTWVTRARVSRSRRAMSARRMPSSSISRCHRMAFLSASAAGGGFPSRSSARSRLLRSFRWRGDSGGASMSSAMLRRSSTVVLPAPGLGSHLKTPPTWRGFLVYSPRLPPPAPTTAGLQSKSAANDPSRDASRRLAQSTRRRPLGPDRGRSRSQKAGLGREPPRAVNSTRSVPAQVGPIGLLKCVEAALSRDAGPRGDPPAAWTTNDRARGRRLGCRCISGPVRTSRRPKCSSVISATHTPHIRRIKAPRSEHFTVGPNACRG